MMANKRHDIQHGSKFHNGSDKCSILVSVPENLHMKSVQVVCGKGLVHKTLWEKPK